MTPEAIQAMIDQSVARALAEKDQEISEAIAFGLRTYADRPVGEKGSPSLQYGVVDSVESTFAYVLLDGQTDAVPINMLGGLVEGERVAVLLVPPSGNLAIGMVTPLSPGVLSVVAGTNVTVDDTDPQNPVVASTGAGGGFPVGPEDDGTGTTEITAVALGGGTSASTWNNINDGDGSTAQILLATATDRAASQMGWTADSGAAVTDQRDAQGGPNTALWQIGTRNDAGDHICLFRALATASGSQNTVQAEIVEVVATAASGLIISGLPSTDPGVSGQLWADPITNIVMVSP